LEHGDKIILPASALEQLLEQSNTLPSPLTFELRHPHSGAIIHGGVKEFSSSDNVQLPAWMLNALKLQPNDHVVIRLCSLPKGSWTQLIPLSADYREIIDYRAALEAHLRGNYTALSKGQILSCYYGGQTYDFKVEQLKPQDAVSITDTDLEVDLLPINEQDQVIRRKNSTVHEIVQLDQTVDTQIEPNAYTYWKLDMSQANTDAIDIELKVLDGDAGNEQRTCDVPPFFSFSFLD
jgi:hypothetical protein